jgi:hypothetical protein
MTDMQTTDTAADHDRKPKSGYARLRVRHRSLIAEHEALLAEHAALENEIERAAREAFSRWRKPHSGRGSRVPIRFLPNSRKHQINDRCK